MAQCLEFLNALMNKSYCYGDVPDGPVAKTPYPQCRGLGSIPGQGTRSLMPQLRVHKIPHAAMKIENPTCQNKTWHSQINKKNLRVTAVIMSIPNFYLKGLSSIVSKTL